MYDHSYFGKIINILQILKGVCKVLTSTVYIYIYIYTHTHSHFKNYGNTFAIKTYTLDINIFKTHFIVLITDLPTSKLLLDEVLLFLLINDLRGHT